MRSLHCFVILSTIVVINSATLPQWLKKCTLSNDVCLKENAQNGLAAFIAGIPELGVKPMDPTELGDVNIELSGLKMKLTKSNAKGFKSAVFKTVKFDMAQKKLDIELDADLTLKSNYFASGMLLILPIRGEGDLKIKIKGVRVHCTIPFVLAKGADGKEYIKLQGVENTFDVKTGVHFALTNLFYGNKQLSDIMHNFINTNWKLISAEFAGPVMDAVVEKSYENLKAFFDNLPLEDISQ